MSDYGPTKSRQGIWHQPTAIIEPGPAYRGQHNHSVADRCDRCNQPSAALYPCALPDQVSRFTYSAIPETRVCVKCLGEVNGARRKGRKISAPRTTQHNRNHGGGVKGRQRKSK